MARESGAAVVEFALVVPVLFFVVFAVIDFGRALWTQNVLIAAVREGARYGASRPSQCTPGATGCTVTAQAQPALDSASYQAACYIGRVLRGASDCPAAVALYPVSNVRAVINTTAGPNYGQITVDLPNGYSYTPATPFAARFGLSALTFRPVAVFRWEQAS